MNNIYKVIWSKAKNCYVVASEIARSHTKSASGSEKIGGVARHALLALGAACAIACGGFVNVGAYESVDVTTTGGSNAKVYTADATDSLVHDKVETGIRSELNYYYKKSDVDANYYTKSDVDTKLEALTTTGEVATNKDNITKLDGKTAGLSADGKSLNGMNSVETDALTVKGEISNGAGVTTTLADIKDSMDQTGTNKTWIGRLKDKTTEISYNAAKGTTVSGVDFKAAEVDANGKGLTGVSTLNTTGAATIGGALTAAGVDAGTGDIKGGSLSVTGAVKGSSVDAGSGEIKTTGAVNAGTLNTTGDATVGGDLNATGKVSGNGLDAKTGAITGGSLSVTGAVKGSSVDAGSGEIKTTGAVNAGTLNTTGDATVGGDLNATGKVSGNGLDAKTGAITGGNLSVTGAVKGSSVDAGSGEIKTTGAVNAGTLSTTGDATVGGDLKVTGTITTDKMVFGDPATNNYTEIDKGKVTSKNSVVNGEGQLITSSSIFNAEENKVGFANNTTGDQSFHKQTSDIIMDNVKDLHNSNNRTQTKTETKDIITDENGNSSTTSQTASENKTYLKDKDGKNTNSTIDTAKGYDKTIKGENGETSTKQDELNITNIAQNGTIKNDAMNIENNATGDMTNNVGGKLTTTVTGQATENFNGGLDTNVTGKENHTVTGDQNIHVTGKQTNEIGGDQENTIGGNQTTTVEGNVKEDYKNDLTTTVGGNELHEVTGNKTENVTGMVKENYSNGQETNVTGNQDIYVSENQTNTIDGNQVNTIGGDQTTTVEGKVTETYKKGQATNVTGNQEIHVTENQTNKIDGNQENTIGGDQTTTVEGKVTETYKKGQATNVTGNQEIHVTENQTNKIDGNQENTVGGDQTTNVTGNISNKAKNITNEATDTLTDKVGDNTRVINGEGITDTVGGSNLKSRVTQKKGSIETVVTDGTSFNHSRDIPVASTKTLTGYGKMNQLLDDLSSSTKTITDGTHKTSKVQTALDITNTAADGTITNDAKDIVNKAQDTITNTAGTKITDTAGDSTVTTENGKGTTFTKRGSMAYRDGGPTDTNISGNTITTGKVTMDYAEVMKDLGVGGNANIAGTTTTKTLNVTEDASVGRDLSVGSNATIAGDVTARSYKVDGKTYIDANGINANNQKITNVADGSISEGSKDAVNGGQLYGVKRDLEHQVDKVGANAAAMANLRPMEFDPSSKWNIAAAIGNYGSETAAAIGAFYRPNDNVMVNLSTAFGTGENMVGGGVSVRLGKGGNKLSREETNALKAQVADLTARMDALLSVLNPNMSKDFPDVPENHWAYEAVSRLAGNDIVQGYPDGEFHGERTMTRYEMAEIIYNALSRGAEAERELVEEFKPELQAMAASEKSTAEKAEG